MRETPTLLPLWHIFQLLPSPESCGRGSGPALSGAAVAGCCCRCCCAVWPGELADGAVGHLQDAEGPEWTQKCNLCTYLPGKIFFVLTCQPPSLPAPSSTGVCPAPCSACPPRPRTRNGPGVKARENMKFTHYLQFTFLIIPLPEASPAPGSS